MKSNYEFLSRIHEEKLESQKRRAVLIRRKFLFVGTLFSFGAIKLTDEMDFTLILYIVPVISICFDLFIIGEDYGIKRIGVFVAKKYIGTLDSDWEKWVRSKRDPFGKLALPILTLLILMASVAVLWSTQYESRLFWVWIVLNVCATIFIFVYSQHLRNDLHS